MGQLVKPEVYLVGYSTIDPVGLGEYLKNSGNKEFMKTVIAAREAGISEAETLISAAAKLCYASLSVGHNDNITRVRDIPENLKATWDQGHGSVWEHCNINFIVRNCSRVYTHEQVRHRVGVAYSQTSGRYVRGSNIDFIHDPILDEVKDDIQDLLSVIQTRYNQMVEKLGLDKMTDFTLKKKLTSALRRILPNGQSNEIFMSLNLRSLRHIVQMRTSRSAEWEIRYIYDQVYRILKDRFPLLFYGAVEQEIDGLLEISGMKNQPY